MEEKPLLGGIPINKSEDHHDHHCLPSEDKSAAMRKSTWIDATSVLLGIILGSGALGLPYAMIELGWYLGVFSCVAFAAFATYSGILLSRVRNRFCPGCESFTDVALIVCGPKFAGFTKWAIWINWLVVLPYYLMGATRALDLAVGGNLCFYYRSLIITAILIVPLQLRTLSALSKLAALSGAAIIVAVVLCLTDFFLPEHDDAGFNVTEAPVDMSTSFWPSKGASFLNVYGSTSSFIFAYQGQSLMLEVMREMKKPQQFSRAVMVSNIIMCLVYGAISVIAYDLRGASVKPFLPDSINTRWIKRAVGCLTVYHLLCSYLLSNVPLAIAWHEKIWPATARDFVSAKSRLHWFIMTMSLLVFSFLVGNAIPFFGDFQGLIGSALGAPIVFGWPAYFYIAASRKYNSPVSIVDYIVCGFFIFVMMPTCTIVGFYSSADSLVQNFKSDGLPFSCDL